MIFNDKMCSSGQLHRPQQLTNLVDPFSFSALHLLRTYNRLLAPTDVAQCYNLTLMKEHGPPSTTTNSTAPGLLIDKNNFQLHPLTILPKKINHQIDLPTESRQLFIQCDLNDNKLHGAYDCHSPSHRAITTSCHTTSSPNINNYKLNECFENSGTTDVCRERNSIDSINGSISGRRQRGEKRPIPDEQKDEKYYERRKRNNEAAKKSRDARKIREDRIAFRAAMLEQENAILRAQLVALREEITTLRQMLCVRTNSQIS